MAILIRSIVGRFNGKIGEAVLTKWKTILVGKSLPTKSTKPPTVAQLVQRLRFGLVTGFFSNLADFIAIGYQNHPEGVTPMNFATQSHFSAITGVYPNYVLDFTKIKVSNPWKLKYEIDGGFTPAAVAIAGNKVTVSWILTDVVQNKSTLDTDMAYLVFYSVNKGKFVTYGGIAERSLLKATATMPRSFIGDKFHGYLFFVSPDGKLVSESEYLGQFTLIA